MKGFLVAIMILAAGAVPVAAQSTIRLRADNWCPYNCTPGDEKPGYMVEIAQTIFGKDKLDYQLMPWSRAVEAAREGQLEAVAGATQADAAGFVFGTEPMGMSVNVIITRRGSNFRYQGAESLKALKLAAVQDYSYGEEVDAYIAANRDKVDLLSGDDVTVQNLRKLLAKRVDAVIEDMNVAEYSLAAQGMDGLVEIHPIDEATALYIAFAPGNPIAAEQARQLDEGVRKLRRNGTLSRLLARYGLGDWAPQMAAAPQR
jgi:polar amino acid transport system substrate-binding protein